MLQHLNFVGTTWNGINRVSCWDGAPFATALDFPNMESLKLVIFGRVFF